MEFVLIDLLTTVCISKLLTSCNVCQWHMYVIVVSSGATDTADWTTLSARERRSYYSSVNGNTKRQPTADFAFELKNLPNRCPAGSLRVSGKNAFLIAVQNYREYVHACCTLYKKKTAQIWQKGELCGFLSCSILRLDVKHHCQLFLAYFWSPSCVA